MSKTCIDGVEHGKGHFFISQVLHSGLIRRNKNPSSPKTMFSEKLSHDLLGEPHETKREPMPILKSLFTRRRGEITAKSGEKSPSTETPLTPKDVSSKHEGKLSLPRSMSLRGNFSVRDLTEKSPAKQNAPNRSFWNQAKSPVINSSPKDFPIKSPKRSPKDVATWEPPPLFQAFPQALKYSHLPVLSLSTDAILRIDGNRKACFALGQLSNISHRTIQDHNDTHEPNMYGENLANSSLSCRHRRQPCNNVTKDEWVQKVFVLLASGYLLQYSGTGTFDRLPEKVMQLCKDSVAFASDVIPGKHWVLQVSQSMNSDGVPAAATGANSRTFISRLVYRGPENKRTTTCFLLVLKSAEDLESWMTILRKEIAKLGTKKHGGETTRYVGEDKPLPPLQDLKILAQDSVYSSPGGVKSSLQPVETDPRVKDDFDLQKILEDCNPMLLRRQKTSAQQAVADHHSMTNSFVSQDGKKLESLVGSQNRYSYMSSGQRTFFTSQASSPNASPILVACDTFNNTTINDDSKLRPTSVSKSEHRLSLQPSQLSRLHPQNSIKNFRLSSTGSSRSLSPAQVASSRKQKCESRGSKIDATPSPKLPLEIGKLSVRSSVSSSPVSRPHSCVDMPHTLVLNFNNYLDSINLSPSPVIDLEISQRKNLQAKTPSHRSAKRSPSAIQESTLLSVEAPPPTHILHTVAKATEDKVPASSRVGHNLPSTYSRNTLSRTLKTSYQPTQTWSSAGVHDDKDIIIIKPSRRSKNRTFSTGSRMHRVSSSGDDNMAVANSNHIADQLAPKPYSYVPLSNHVHSSSSYYLKFQTPAHLNLPHYSPFLPNFHTSISGTEITEIKAHQTEDIAKSRKYDLKSELNPVSCKIHAGPQHRRSLPTLVSGPPPLPPPNCALPPLPPAGYPKKTRIGLNLMKGASRSISDAYP